MFALSQPIKACELILFAPFFHVLNISAVWFPYLNHFSPFFPFYANIPG